MIWVITAVLGVLCSILAAEVLDICPWLTEALLIRAAVHIPLHERERYLAEWRAEHDYIRTRRGRVFTILWAVGVYASSRRLAAEVPKTRRRARTNWVQLPLFSEPPTICDDRTLGVRDIDIPTVIRQMTGAKEEEDLARTARPTVTVLRRSGGVAKDFRYKKLVRAIKRSNQRDPIRRRGA